jgi:high-affinity iron transporter
MFATGLIVFRETLEAALFIGIIAASTRGLLNRSRWLALGVAVGAFGSLVMASAIGAISSWADGVGQEIVSATILGTALVMLAWHCIWVSAHAHQTVQEAKRLGKLAAQGEGSLWALALAVALSVLREGAETVLFVAGLMSSADANEVGMAVGALLGLSLGCFTGWLIYAGLGRIRPQYLFGVTNGLIVLLAGNLASQIAKTANQADWISSFSESAWDVAWLVSNDSFLGMVMHGLIGFDANPSQLQLIFYAATTVSMWWATAHMKNRLSPRLARV